MDEKILINIIEQITERLTEAVKINDPGDAVDWSITFKNTCEVLISILNLRNRG